MLYALPRKGILKSSFSAAITSHERKSRKYRPKGNNLGGRIKKYYADKSKEEASEYGLGVE